MELKNLYDLEISEMTDLAERRIINIINILDAILLAGREPQNEEAANNIAGICYLCDTITGAYERVKSVLNELQQG